MLPYKFDTFDRVQLRVRALRRLRDWDGKKSNPSDYQKKLAQVLGYESYVVLKEVHRDAHAFHIEQSAELSRKLKMLAGPNGWAVYKAMLARQDK